MFTSPVSTFACNKRKHVAHMSSHCIACEERRGKLSWVNSVQNVFSPEEMCQVNSGQMLLQEWKFYFQKWNQRALVWPEPETENKVLYNNLKLFGEENYHIICQLNKFLCEHAAGASLEFQGLSGPGMQRPLILSRYISDSFKQLNCKQFQNPKLSNVVG